MKNSKRNICTCTQIWTILSVLTKTKPNPTGNSNPITFLKFLELIGNDDDDDDESVQDEGSTEYKL